MKFLGVVPHYALRYGFAPATGDLQLFRGRPPLLRPLQQCIHRSFTAGNTGSNRSGDTN
jgi:hypothetical protein